MRKRPNFGYATSELKMPIQRQLNCYNMINIQLLIVGKLILIACIHQAEMVIKVFNIFNADSHEKVNINKLFIDTL